MDVRIVQPRASRISYRKFLRNTQNETGNDECIGGSPSDLVNRSP